MSSVIEMLASKKKAAPPPETVVLPMLQKEHSGDCGDGCGCGGSEGGCCGG
ncbi:MAG TPA: hypothetical protein VI999_07325 [Thermoplasmata archaeon]|nr:hypothetical protein [Thermoplasmata archaeon]